MLTRDIAQQVDDPVGEVSALYSARACSRGECVNELEHGQDVVTSNAMEYGPRLLSAVLILVSATS
jgi:hypothetical protein